MIEFYTPLRTTVIHEIGVSQVSRVGNTKELNMTLLIRSGQTFGNQNDDSLTVEPLLIGDAALSITTFAERQFNPAFGGTIVTHYVWHWNVRYPFRHVFTPASRIILPKGRRATFQLDTVPPEPMGLQAYCVVEFLHF
jgi:hypothetical protein